MAGFAGGYSDNFNDSFNDFGSSIDGRFGGIGDPSGRSTAGERANKNSFGTDANNAAARTAPIVPTKSFNDVFAEYNALLGQARNAGTNYFSARGITPDRAGQFYEPLNNRFSQSLESFYGAPTKDNFTDYKSPFEGSNYRTEAERLAANALDTENSAARQFFGRQIENDFAPFNPDSALPYTADDNIINSILGEQRQTADDFLTRALNRGQLNQTGFQSGVQSLNTQQTAGNARLQDLGKGVIDQGRGQLGTIKSNALSEAGGFSIGNPFDPSSFTNNAQNSLNDFNSGLEGNIRAALGGSSVFDPASSVSFGGNAQGVSNTGVENSSLFSAIQGQRNRQIQQQRGLGNQGVF